MKRLVSIALSICMVAMLVCLPVAFAAAPTTVYEFEAPLQQQDTRIERDGETAYLCMTDLADGAAQIPKTAQENAVYSFEVPADGSYYMWVRAKSPSNDENTSWFAVDDGGYFIFFLKHSAVFSWNRVQLGYLKQGTHTLRVKARKTGQYLDRFLVTEDASYIPSDAEQNEESETEGDYLPGQDWLETDTAIPFFEKREGGWLIEAEDGLLTSPMEVYEDETASGEKYAAAKLGSPKNLDPYANETPHARYKFRVDKKGQYTLYMRVWPVSSSAKSTWVSIDGVNYTEHNTSASPTYKFASFNFLLDVGYHEISLCYREAGERLDNLMLIEAGSSFRASGLGSLPGEPIRPKVLSYAERMIPRIYINGTELLGDADIQKKDGAYMAPIRNLAEYMGITYYIGEDYVLYSKGRSYLKVMPGSRTASANGQEITMKQAPFYVDTTLMIDFEAFTEVFDIPWSTEDGIALNVESYTMEIDEEESEELEIFSTTAEELSYTLDLPDKTAVITPYVNVAGTNIWRKGTPLRYGDDRKWHGSFTELKRETGGTVKLSVLTQGELRYYYRSFDPLVWCEYPTVYSFIPHGDGLILRQTFENMSYYLDVDRDDYQCEILYRRVGDADWKTALAPFFDAPNLQFRGSITYLTQDTEYEVKAVLSFGGEKKEYTASVRTWADEVPIAREVKLSEIYDPEEYEGCMVLENLKGTEDGWIKIVGDEVCDTVRATRNVSNAIYVANCEYLIFEGINVRGGNKNGFCIVNNSEHIRIQNCDISEWGRYGVLPEKTQLHTEYDGSVINNDAAVLISNVKNVVVERVYVHDPTGRTNSWKWGHPYGMNAVFVRGRGGVVIRYNDFIGSDEARWNDAIECKGNGTINGGLSLDSDVYGNSLMLGNDDSIEFDDAQMNVRFYNNRVEGFLVGVSTIPQMVGPSYVYRNLFTNLGDERDSCNNVMKNGGGYPTWNYGIIHFIHNTAYVKCTGINGLTWLKLMPADLVRMFSRNNLLICGTAPTYYTIKDVRGDPISSYDYDLMASITGADEQSIYPEGQEAHGIKANPEFTAPLEGLYTLTASSPGVDGGTYLHNFAEEYTGSAPDVGALEYGVTGREAMLPVLPISLWADKYQVTVPEGRQTAEVTIHTGDDVPKGTGYKLCVNALTKWMTVENEDGTQEGVIGPNQEIKIKVKTDSDQKGDFGYANGAFLFRLDSGYAVSVSVYGGKYE